MKTTSSPKNLLLILSDEHNPKVMGCAGHPDVLTPNLDFLASRGRRFINATCASPICVPARAALATGRNVFELETWDNVTAYDGVVKSWHHILRESGHEVNSIGKLHYRGWESDDYGFSDSILPMHIHAGRGEIRMLLRENPVTDGSKFLQLAGPGISSYNEYDAAIVDSAVDWLRTQADKGHNKPWVLLVSLVAPHFPLTAPPEYYSLYANKDLQLPKDYHFGLNPTAHPYVRQYGSTTPYNLHFKSEQDVHRALCGYYGLVSYLDAQIGKLLDVLEETSLASTTRILYTSDHGDNAGARGLWGKSTMYAESVGVPLIISDLDNDGDSIEANKIEEAAVNHIDIFKTALDSVGCDNGTNFASPRSQSLLQPLDPARITFSEYHTTGSSSGIYMLQNSKTKYVFYCDLPNEFFDLSIDPEEMNNLIDDPTREEEIGLWRTRLFEICDPFEIDSLAKHKQQEQIELYGGRDAILKSNGIGGFSPPPKQSS